jgi:GT2 family glycosyltransferase
VLGEIGMDTLRHGETAQAEFLAGHTKEAMLCGLAGSFVFSYTDEWHTGNHTITDWAFGITEADRNPKPSYHALRELFEQDFCELLVTRPKVSVVVCSYNGGPTLGQCLESLGQVEYDDYEVIVVDDGSTDDTPEILKRFPWVRAIRQANQGLSAARNAGLQAATGEVIAYTDSDCFVDADWLTLLIAQLQHSGAAAVGGPNLSPEDGWLAACVAASPGQPTHVLESDQVAEHIPGCNMAFRREALEAINGFDPQYRKAGDDVDVCWRLQQSGRWITFAPGAFVWHHRRQGPRAYLKQQAGYGDAEALLRFKHPDRFNGRGDGIWRGVMYATGLQGLRLRRAIIYSGTYATGLFQCIYQPTPAHWAMLPTTLEWHLVTALFVLVGLGWPWSFAVAGIMLAISVLVTAGQTAQARLERRHDGLRSRLVVFMLSYAQPLVRSWHRYRTRLFTAQPPGLTAGSEAVAAGNMPLTGRRTLALWTEHGHDRVQLLDEANRQLSTSRWGNRIGTGWTTWDLEIDCYPGTVVRVTTAQENYGGLKRVIRIQFRVHPRPLVVPLFSTVCLTVAVLSSTPQWLLPLAGVCAGLLAVWWWRSVRLAGHIVALFQGAATSFDLIPCAQPHGAPRSALPDAVREATQSTE